MTELTRSLIPAAWENTADAIVSVADWATRHMLLGLGLGLTGLAVVLAFTALLIGVHEMCASGLSAVLPPEIRFI